MLSASILLKCLEFLQLSKYMNYQHLFIIVTENIIIITINIIIQ